MPRLCVSRIIIVIHFHRACDSCTKNEGHGAIGQLQYSVQKEIP